MRATDFAFEGGFWGFGGKVLSHTHTPTTDDDGRTTTTTDDG